MNDLARRVDVLEHKLDELVKLISGKHGVLATPVFDEPQLYTREQVIGIAKVDVLSKTIHAIKVEYHINRAKGRVTAVVRRILSDSTLSVGRAHVRRGDVFNVYIGKAIALYRALGLVVPECYTNAPQPTQVYVGDIVTWISSGNSYSIEKIYENTRDRYDLRDTNTGTLYADINYLDLGFQVDGIHVLTDDSHDYGGRDVISHM